MRVNDPEGKLPAVELDDGPDMLKERISTALSTVAVLMLTAGLTWGLWPETGPWALSWGGALLAFLVTAMDRARRPVIPEHPIKAQSTAPPKPLPGPTDAGNLHTRGPRSKP
jgi:hypothetical protein